MNIAQDSADSVLTRLLALAECPNAEGYACIAARREHGARAVDVERPQLSILLRGRKRVRWGETALEFVPGDLLVIARRCALDVVNVPEAGNGLYLTLALPLCDEVLDAARLLWAQPLAQGGPAIVREDVAAFAHDLLQWCAALQAGGYVEARVALTSLVVGLCRRGHTALLVPPPPSVAAQVREIVSREPARAWRSRDFEDALGLSGPTLRRRLSDEDTNLRDVIAAARLARALDLLYTTRWPVKTVAARVGYRSAASFVRRFVERYGTEPDQIGNA